MSESAIGASRPAPPFVVPFFTFPSGHGIDCTFTIYFTIIFFSAMRHATIVSLREIVLTASMPTVILSS